MERKGDIGLTDSIARKNIRKDDGAIVALAHLDRLNAELGLAKLEAPQFAESLTYIQQALVGIMARVSGADRPVEDGHLIFLDTAIAQLAQTLPPFKEFVLPGANRAEAMLHLCRTATRLAETQLVAAGAPADVLAFINRLSLYLFWLARAAALK